jgi:hypothetical protein
MSRHFKFWLCPIYVFLLWLVFLWPIIEIFDKHKQMQIFSCFLLGNTKALAFQILHRGLHLIFVCDVSYRLRFFVLILTWIQPVVLESHVVNLPFSIGCVLMPDTCALVVNQLIIHPSIYFRTPWLVSLPCLSSCKYHCLDQCCFTVSLKRRKYVFQISSFLRLLRLFFIFCILIYIYSQQINSI